MNQAETFEEIPPDTADTEGRRERKKRQTRIALHDAAVALFAEKGYVETTITDITDRADVARRTFFRYYDGKEDVLGSDLRDLLPRMLRTLELRPIDEAPLWSIYHAVSSLLPTQGPPAYIFRIGTRADLVPFGRRLMPVLMKWETSIADTLLIRWGVPPRDAAPEWRLRASVTACAATSAMRCAVQYFRMSDDGDVAIVPDIQQIIEMACHILVEGCPAPDALVTTAPSPADDDAAKVTDTK